MISWIVEHWFAILLLLIYLTVMLHHASLGFKDTLTVTDFNIGGRNIGGVTLGISYVATYASTNTFVGIAGQGYVSGFAWMLLPVFSIIFGIIAWKWFAPRIRMVTAKLDSVTIPDFIGFRFNSNVARFLAAIIVIIASFAYMTAIFKGVGNLMEVSLDIPYEIAIAVVFFVVVIYTAVGGFVSVVKTDVVQGVLMLIAAALLFSGISEAAGGVSSIFMAHETPFAAMGNTVSFPVLLGLVIATTIKLIVEPRQLSRFYALKDDRSARQGIYVSMSVLALLMFLLTPIGFYARDIFPAGGMEPDLIVPTLLNRPDIFDPKLAAFLLVAMLAAAMSSLDSVLLVMATTWQRDIAGLIRQSGRATNALRATRISTIVFALVTAVIALDPPSGIVALTVFSGSVYAACFFPSICLGLFWKRGTGAAAITSILSGVAMLLIWKNLPYADQMHEIFPATMFSTLIYLVLAAIGKPNMTPEVRLLFK